MCKCTRPKNGEGVRAARHAAGMHARTRSGDTDNREATQAALIAFLASTAAEEGMCLFALGVVRWAMS